jgi:predicted RNase H-like nuclease (RuvC/YqgF family)
MKPKLDAAKPARAPRYVHLGERLAALARIRRGDWSIDDAVEQLGVTRVELAEWQERHRDDRVLSFEEARSVSPEAHRLRRRAANLARLVEATEREIRELHQELLQSVQSPKQFGQEDTPVQDPSRTRNRNPAKAVISLTRG